MEETQLVYTIVFTLRKNGSGEGAMLTVTYRESGRLVVVLTFKQGTWQVHTNKCFGELGSTICTWLLEQVMEHYPAG
jgi:hypothetical protein